MTSSTRENLLQHAQRLMRARGYNDFSYRDLTRLVGVKTASVHYHFPTKEDLALAAVNDYREQTEQALAQIDPALPPLERLERYEALVREVFSAGELSCLCGMLGNEIFSLPEQVRVAVRSYYERNEAWLAELFAQAQQRGEIGYRGDPAMLARLVYAAYQGGLGSGWLMSDEQRIADVRRVIAQV